MRFSSVPSVFVSVLAIASTSFVSTSSAAPWNCHIEIGADFWDLTPLNAEKTISWTRPSPPSDFEAQIRFNLCDELKPLEGYDSSDQCPSGTLACLTETNKKPNDGADRITSVIPLASSNLLDVHYVAIPPAKERKGVILTLHGPAYPDTSSTRQSLNVTLLCSSSSEPYLQQYDPSTGVANIEWSTERACPSQNQDGGDNSPHEPEDDTTPDTPSSRGRGSGIGWFFLLLILGLLAYFGLGAYYNYNHYGSTGWDLIPHRDFWREVPYLIEDLVSYLFSSVRSGGGSRSGYVSV